MKKKLEFVLDGGDIARGLNITVSVRIKKTWRLRLGLWLMALGARIGEFGFQEDSETDEGSE